MSSSHDPQSNQSGAGTALDDRQVDLEGFDPEPRGAGRRRWLGLSGSQVGSSAGAAVTSAVFASYFGVAGTLIGAALGSIVSTVAGALYSRSMERAALTVRETHAVIVRRAGLTQALPTDVPAMRAPAQSDGLTDGPDDAAPGPQAATLELPAVSPVPPGKRRFAWLPHPFALLGVGLAGFLIAVGAITLAEGLLGHPLSGGDSGSSVSKVFTSTSGTSTGTSDDDTPTPTATVTETATPGASATTKPSASATTARTTSPSATSSTTSAPSTTAPSTGTTTPSTTLGSSDDGAAQ